MKNHEMENYIKEEVADTEGDEVKAKHKKMSISISIGYHMYHPWRLPRICSMKWTACTKMTLRTQLKDVKTQMSENIQQEISAQGAIRSHWRQCQRSISIDYNFEWSSKFSQESWSRRKITYGGMHVRRSLIDSKRRRDGLIWQSIPNNSC